MKRFALVAAIFGLLVGGAGQSLAASLVAQVDVASQTMTVTKQGRVIHVWKVSTARKGYITPRGSWRPTRMHKMWHSRKYDNAPMPWAVFFAPGGVAFHQGNLDYPSGGCIRLEEDDAKFFFNYLQAGDKVQVK